MVRRRSTAHRALTPQNPTRATGFALIGGAIILVVVLLTVVVVQNVQKREHWPTLPPQSASLETTERVYLEAIKENDCALAVQLSDPSQLPQNEVWCNDPQLISYSDLSEFTYSNPPEAAVDEWCNQFNMITKGSSDGTIPPGSYTWGICFTHTADGYRVVDYGVG